MKIDATKLQMVIVGRMLNIQKLAKLMGVRTHVLRSVMERESCTADMACRIAEALEVDVTEISKKK